MEMVILVLELSSPGHPLEVDGHYEHSLSTSAWFNHGGGNSTGGTNNEKISIRVSHDIYVMNSLYQVIAE